jgi:uncharacterized protein
MACSKPSRDASPSIMPPPAESAQSPTPEASTPDAKRASVVLAGTQGERKVTVEVVSSPRSVERGLMYRQFMPPDAGMLFLMGEEEVHSFWMRNTLIPLDMIFIGKDLKVVGVVENAEPRTDTSRSVGKPSLYVLEVNGGWTSKNGIGAGAAVRFDDVEAAAR